MPRQKKRGWLHIIFGIKRFQLYLYGRKFKLVTDHQPLTRIFGPKSSVSPLAAARLQRWAVLLLSGYDFDITFKTSADSTNPDFFSRFPLQSLPDHEDLDPDLHYVFATVTDELPVTAAEIAEGTKTDSLLVKVYEYTSSGWLGTCPSPELRPFWNRRDKLALENGCLLWGRRVIISLSLQKRLLEELRECHPGDIPSALEDLDKAIQLGKARDAAAAQVHTQRALIHRLEALALESRFGRHDAIVLGIYRPPTAVGKDYYNRLESDLNNLVSWAYLQRQLIVVTGDLNMDRLKPDEKEGKILCDLEQIHNLECLIKKPIRVTKTSQTLLDVMMTNKPEMFRTANVYDPGINDHAMVYGIMRERGIHHSSRVISVRSHKSIDEAMLLQDISSAPWHVGEIFDSIDDQYFYWKALLNDVLHERIAQGIGDSGLLTLTEEQLRDFKSIQDIRDSVRIGNGPKFSFSKVSQTEVQSALANLNVNKRFAMYADDHQVYSAGEKIEDVETILNDEGTRTSEWYQQNLLKCNQDKSQAMSLGPRHKKKRMNLNIKDINIKSSSGIDLLGVAIDDDLNFTKHINNVCTKGARKVGVLMRTTMETTGSPVIV
ncbi:hypothetical protein AWC38_SpisGene23804 [Stylophora pistillata]|uniref:Reverse transcriptase RNase H-like domain-containing protein n=1 Tax=Stylophora pistillata TaxID=50429 RepID=A0A2B4R1M2_STYPI|nr:hypothetical protein AWC38_SpisGene23804 [Stylophora pistillata]